MRSYPDSGLDNGHREECQYCWMAEVIEQLDAARDQLLDKDDKLAYDGNVPTCAYTYS